MLHGDVPFLAAEIESGDYSELRYLRAVRKGNYAFASGARGASESARGLIAALLEYDPAQRLAAPAGCRGAPNAM